MKEILVEAAKEGVEQTGVRPGACDGVDDETLKRLTAELISEGVEES